MYGCNIISLYRQRWPQILKFWVIWGVSMMPLHDGWGCHPPQTDHIHIRHVQHVWGIGMLSQGHIGAPLYHYTGQVDPRFWRFGSLVEWKWCNYIMIEAHIYFRLPPTSIGMLSHRPIGAPLYRYTGKFGLRFLDFFCHLWSWNDTITSWLRLISTSDCFPHP